MARQLKHGRGKLVLAILAIGLVVAAVLFWQRAQTFADRPLQIDAPQVLLIDAGDGFNTILSKLRKLGVRQGSDLEWKALARSIDVADRLQVGEYAISSGLSPRALLQRLASGAVIQRKFTIVEGWSFAELRRALARDPRLEHVIDRIDDAELMARIDRKGVHPEGRFLPETYVFSRGTDELSVLDRAADAMDEVLADAWSKRAPDLPLQTPDELLVLASIVEKETGLATERPAIAGVFVRRLKLGMRLQTDPTVIYGMGSSYAGNIRKVDLERDTPYNTYTRAGLPPTPIAMPGKHALMSAAQPAGGNTLYFVAHGNGGHHFSASLAEHNAAVRKYQLKR